MVSGILKNIYLQLDQNLNVETIAKMFTFYQSGTRSYCMGALKCNMKLDSSAGPGVGFYNTRYSNQ